ncbi:hypothetical protein MYOV003v1_p0052 [Vibrio phage 207E48.1]|nr:hypothetical protein MYOV003v1_p0052 [Vibrio phage 207E48.1]
MVIERQFITGDPNFWEPFDTNPIDLKSASGVASSYISGGTFRYTVKDLDSKYEVWLKTVISC